MIVACDFDGTLGNEVYPSASLDLYPTMIMKQAADNGHRIILWTCRHDDALYDAIEECAKYGLHFVAVNSNDPVHMKMWEEETGDKNYSPKVFANVYIDDRSVLPGKKLPWEEIDEMLNGIPDFEMDLAWYQAYTEAVGEEEVGTLLNSFSDGAYEGYVQPYDLTPSYLRGFHAFVDYVRQLDEAAIEVLSVDKAV